MSFFSSLKKTKDSDLSIAYCKTAVVAVILILRKAIKFFL